jgi:hypothetical protein
MVCRSIWSLAGAVARQLNHLALSEYVILAGARIPTAGDPRERHHLRNAHAAESDTSSDGSDSPTSARLSVRRSVILVILF